jgi:hypothetical protein
MTTQFKNFKLSLIWVETIPAIFAQELGAAAPYAFLGKPGQFAKKFDELKAPGGSSKALGLPWQKPQGHHFWKHYFAGRHAGDISGADAWKNLVPLRGEMPFKITLEPPDPPGPSKPRVTFEVFYTPQGLGLVANAYYRGKDKSIEEIAALAHAFRYRYRFRMEAERAGGGMSLQSAADRALAAVRVQAFGNAEAFAGYDQPFTIATFVQGQTDNPDQEVRDGSPVHRVLEALTGWNENFATMNVEKTPIASAKLAIRTRADSDLVYARKGGRAIWLPREFGTSPARPRLSCYHRNITLASLQTMSLGECVGLVARRLERGEKVSPLLLARAKAAARALDVLASGDRTATYRTMSIDAQIKAANWRASMDIIAKSA